jgi:hypothetical protein
MSAVDGMPDASVHSRSQRGPSLDPNQQHLWFRTVPMAHPPPPAPSEEL